MSKAELIQVCVKGTEAVVSFPAGKLNQFESARGIAGDFCELIENGLFSSHPIVDIKVDLRGIDRISSAGLNGLIQMNSKSRSHGVRMVLLNVPTTVLEVFKLTRIERMFDFDVTPPAAVPVVT
tara:strand:- start:278 stop:649 length:372 start_codon:yes stop_codon:yes gene_type:complete